MFKRTMLFVGLFGGVLLGTLVFSTGLFPHILAASPESTKVIRFRPSGIRGTLDTPADCWETSLAAPRADAWRCIVGNTIYDPCFSTQGQENYVICDANPADDGRGLQVKLAHALPASTVGQGIQAWLMRLADGSVCGFLTGATGLVNGERINYACNNGAQIIGIPQMESIWLVKEMKKGESQVVKMSVVEAWT